MPVCIARGHLAGGCWDLDDAFAILRAVWSRPSTTSALNSMLSFDRVSRCEKHVSMEFGDCMDSAGQRWLRVRVSPFAY